MQRLNGNEDPIRFEVAYRMHHTCKPVRTGLPSVVDSSCGKTNVNSVSAKEPENNAAELRQQANSNPVSALFTELDLDRLLSCEPETNIPLMADWISNVPTTQDFNDMVIWSTNLGEFDGSESWGNFFKNVREL